MPTLEEYLNGVQQRQQKTALLESNIGDAANTNPDEFANMVKLSRASAVAVDAVPDYLDLAKSTQLLKKTNVPELVDTHPKTSQFLSDPDKAKLASDDIDNFKATEGVFGKIGDFFDVAGGVAKTAALNSSAGIVGFVKAPIDLLNDAAGYVLPVRPFTPLTNALNQYKNSIEAQAKAATPKVEGDVAKGLVSGGISLVQNTMNLPLLFAGPGGQSAYWASTLTPVFGNEYNKAKDKGLGTIESINYASTQTGFEYLTEKIPMGRLLGDLKAGTPFYKTLMHQLATEIPTEQAATLLQDLTEWATLNPEKPFQSYIDERPSAALQTLVATVVGVGGSTVISTSLERATTAYANRAEQAERGEKIADVIANMNKLSAANKVRTRDGETFQDWINQVSEDSPVQNVYINAETLKQSGMDKQLQEIAPEIAEQVETAAAMGRDIQIPIADYMTKIAPTPLGDAMLDDLRAEGETMTRREAREFIDNKAAELQAAADQMMQQKENDQKFIDSAKEVETNMFDQLKAIGVYTNAASKNFATYVRDIYVTKAAAMGITPGELYAMIPYKITAEMPAPNVQLFSQDGKVKLDTDAFKAFYGNSIFKDDQGAPVLLYHGTADDVTTFDVNHPNRKDSGWLGTGVYLTDNVDMANLYADQKARTLGPKGQNVMPLYARLENPYYATAEDKARVRAGGREAADAFTADLQAQGYDGVIYQPTSEAREVVVFDSTAVKSQFNDGTWSNENNLLTQKKLIDIDTPEFKAWFGNSQILDVENNPLVVYHGSSKKGIKKFNTGDRGIFYATSDEYYADAYAENTDNGAVYPLYMRMEKPAEHTDQKVMNVLVEHFQENAEDISENFETGNNAFEYFENDEVITKLKALGYDGVFVPEEGQISYGVFDTSQVKSIYNNGAFDKTNDIYNQKAKPQKPGPDAPGVGLEEGNKLGFWPALRIKLTGKLTIPEKPSILTGTTNKNAAKQIAAIDGILKKFPKATESTTEWSRMMAYALGSAEVPIPPYAFIRDLNGTGSLEKLRLLTQGQIDDATHGFKNAAEFRRAYTSGELGVATTGKLFMWSFLSRGVSPYTQEGLFIDAFDGADKWIAMAAKGEFNESVFPEYEAWAKSVAPAGSGQPGSGATHNLNAFGQDFLFKMSKVGEDKKTHMQRLHDMMCDPKQTGKQIRREFAKFGEGVGIDNKVVSFTLLVAGFPDVMVLDRVQIRQLWDDGKFNGINLYDGVTEKRMVTGKDGVAKEKNVRIAGSSLNNLAEGVRGILVYEAIERGLESKIQQLYTDLGRPQDASIGRYHWETWVADSQQEASHGTLGAILADAKGDDTAIANVSAKQGEYGAYEYGALYNRDETSTPWFGYETPTGGKFAFSVPAFRAFLNEIKTPSFGVVPTKFKVTESGNAPWYNRPEVNKERLNERAAYWADRAGGTGEGQRAIEEAVRQQAANGVGSESGNATLNQLPIAATTDERTGLPLNPDGTVTLYHHTSAEAAGAIKRSGQLVSAGEPDVYLTTRRETDTGYGDTVVTVRVNPDRLNIDDEFPNGRQDFRINVGQPGGAVQVLIGDYQSILNQPARGGFDPKSLTTILTKESDYSTFIHETTHFYLDMLTQLADMPNAPQQFKDDLTAVLEWSGATPQEWAAWNQEFKDTGKMNDGMRKVHEAFAYNSEIYIATGNAPSLKMQTMFDQFAAWLRRVYKSIRDELNVIYRQEHGEDLPILTGEVRQVMDRMLASEEQIVQAQTVRGMSPFYQTQEASGMDDATWAAYQAMSKEAQDQSVSDLTAASLRQMRWLSNAKSRIFKEMQKQNAEIRKDVRAQVAKEIEQQPIYRALRLIKFGEEVMPDGTTVKLEQNTKLSVSGMEELYMGEGDKYALLDWSSLGYGKYGMLSEDGMHPDALAERVGFSSGDELVRSLLNAKTLKEAVEEKTDQRMLEEYGDLSDQRSMDLAVERALHNEARARFVAAELRHAAKATQPVRVMLAAARQAARRIIGNKLVRDTKVSEYSAAETRATRAAEKAMKEGKPEEVTKQLQNRLLNNQLTAEATKATQEVDKGLRYLKSMQTDQSRKRVGADYSDQVDQLLARFDLNNRSLKSIDAQTSLMEWMKSQEDAGYQPEISLSFQNEGYRKNYKNMTVDEFRDLVDAIKQIEHMGKTEQNMLTAAKETAYKQARDEIVASIDANANGRVANTRTPTTEMGRRIQGLKRFWAAHIKAATVAQILDGGKEGPMWEYFIRSANKRGDQETVMRAKATEHLTEIFAPIFKLGKMGGTGIAFPTINRSLNREARMAIGLNMGNEGNMQRLLDGEGWTREQIQPVLDSLTSEEWLAIQKVWDYFESYRPAIAEKERRIYGKEPKWIEPKALTINLANGQTMELRGGYYPIKYDPMASVQAESNDEKEAAKRQLQGAFTSATTRRSFTKTRVEKVEGRPLIYTLAGMYSGINDVIHDLAWHEWLIDANKLLRSQSIDQAIRTQYGPEFKQQLKTWVEDVAAGERGVQNEAEIGLNYLRQSVSAAGLGFNVMSALQQITGFNQSIIKVGVGYIGRGIAKTIGNPRNAMKEVNEKSSFMANRSRTQFRELNELRNMVQDETAAMRQVKLGAYFMMMRMQRMVDVPTWFGAYEKAIGQGHDEEKSVALADQAVIDSQGGGMVKDLSRVERGGAGLKLFTVYYSYMNTVFNLAVLKGMTEKSKAKLAVDYAMLFVVPVVLTTALKSTLTPGGDDKWDWEKIAKKLAAEELSYLMGTMVIVREFAQAGTIMFGAEKARDYSGPAGVRAVADSITFLKQASQGEFDTSFRKAAINLIGDFTGLPSAQVNRTINGTTALVEGKTENPAAVVLGYEKK